MDKKKPRVDRRKNIGKVAEVLAKKPHATTKEIKEMAKVSQWTVHNATKELELSWTKDPTIAYIVGSSKNRLKKVQAFFDRYLDESLEKEQIDLNDAKVIKDIAKDDLARITVLWWDVTDEFGGLKVSEMSSEELLSLVRWWQR